MFKHYFQDFYYQFRRYPKTTLAAGFISAYFISTFFSWPTLGLLKYALGANAPLNTVNSAQLALFASQYISAFKFWGYFAFSLSCVALGTNFIVNTIQDVISNLNITISIARLKFGNSTEEYMPKLVFNVLSVSPQSLAKYLSEIIKPDFYQALGKSLSKEQNAKLSTSFPSTLSIIETLLLAHIQKCIKNELDNREALSSREKENIIENLTIEHAPKDYIDKLSAIMSPIIGPLIEAEANKTFYGPAYAALNLREEATSLEIKAAYKKLVLTCHPDKVPGKEQQFQNLTRMKYILLNKNKNNLNQKDESFFMPESVRPTLLLTIKYNQERRKEEEKALSQAAPLLPENTPLNKLRA